MRFRSPRAGELPRQVYIETTNRCNSRCQTCVRTFHPLEPARDLSLDEFAAIVAQFPVLERVALHGIGEPLLVEALPAMIRHVKERHPAATVLFNTNAILLDDARQRELIRTGLDEARISLDAASAATYAAIRGVDAFDRVVDNVRHFARLLDGGGRPRLSFWFTTMRENLAELPALVDLAGQLGVREVHVQRLVLIHEGLAQADQSLYRRLGAREEAYLAEAARRAQAHGVHLGASGRISPQQSLAGEGNAGLAAADTGDGPWTACYRMWTSTYITANGNVLPCCISPFSTADYARLILGNVLETPFAEIWNGDGYVERRTALYTEHPLDPCAQCGTNWSL
ncbi:MAG: SPASM domain-containing protein [Anaerolineae bacterium]